MPGTKKDFFLMRLFSSSKNRREIIVWRSCPPSQSIGRGQIRREGSLVVRESREWRDKIFANPPSILAWNFRSEAAVFNGEFQFRRLRYFDKKVTKQISLLEAASLYNRRLLRQKVGGACLYISCLKLWIIPASQFWSYIYIYPPQKLALPRPTKWKFRGKTAVYVRFLL